MIARTLVALSLLVCLPALAETKCKLMEQSFDAEGLGHLSIDVHVGELKVQPSEDGQVHVSVQACPRNGWFSFRKRTAEAAELKVERAQEHMSFTLNKDKYSETWTVRMPPSVALAADVGVGEADINGLASDIDVDMGVGDVQIEGRVADYHRVSGDVGVGEINVDAVSGTGESHRAVVADSETWVADGGEGKATIETDVGVGDADIKLN